MTPLLLLWAGLALAESDPAADFLSLPRYLSEQNFLEVMHASSPAFAHCFEDQAASAVRLTLRVAPSGAVSHAGSSHLDGPPPPADCIEQAACKLDFPAHDESLERWSYTLTWAAGQLQPYPEAEHHERARGPLFLLLPAPADPARHRELQERLGFDPAPAPLQLEEPACAAPPDPAPSALPATPTEHEKGEL